MFTSWTRQFNSRLRCKAPGEPFLSLVFSLHSCRAGVIPGPHAGIEQATHPYPEDIGASGPIVFPFSILQLRCFLVSHKLPRHVSAVTSFSLKFLPPCLLTSPGFPVWDGHLSILVMAVFWEGVVTGSPLLFAFPHFPLEFQLILL